MLHLVHENDSILKEVMPVVVDYRHVSPWIDQMFDLMKKSNGIGLSANQAGLRLRFFVTDVDKPRVYINPEIINSSDLLAPVKEGCLSFPQLELAIKRPVSITVKYIDENFSEVTQDLDGLAARVFQHELDHLNGITFDTHVSRFTLERAKSKRWKKSKAR